MEITQEMHRAGLAAFEEWRAAPLGVGHGDVVSRVLTAALDAAPTFAPALPPPVDNDHVAEGAERFPEPAAVDAEQAIGLAAQDGDATEPKADAGEDPPREPEAA